MNALGKSRMLTGDDHDRIETQAADIAINTISIECCASGFLSKNIDFKHT